MGELPNSQTIRFGFQDNERLEFCFVREELERRYLGAGEWLKPTVHVQAGGFVGTASVFLEASDFARFLPALLQLYETLRGSAELTTIEAQIGFTICGDGKGHVELRGFLLDRAGDGNRLRFVLHYDQTMLQQSITDIERFLSVSGAQQPSTQRP